MVDIVCDTLGTRCVVKHKFLKIATLTDDLDLGSKEKVLTHGKHMIVKYENESSIT